MTSDTKWTVSHQVFPVRHLSAHESGAGPELQLMFEVRQWLDDGVTSNGGRAVSRPCVRERPGLGPGAVPRRPDGGQLLHF